MPRNYLLAVGIMTGNSLDGADIVLSRISRDSEIEDLISHSKPFPDSLRHFLAMVRQTINDCAGNMQKAVQEFDSLQLLQPEGLLLELTADGSIPLTFNVLLEKYDNFVASAVNELLAKARADDALNKAYDLDAIDIVGQHGQTCAHFPPSIAKSRDKGTIYTVQIGNGQRLADLLQIPVAYDFRSDDLMNCGEGAPLAPIHHQHLAAQARKKGIFPLAFCNAGNTGNLSIISSNKETGKLTVMGWDTGPFNNYPDKLMQRERDQSCDMDGVVAQSGKVNEELLQLLFDTAIVTENGENFLLKAPPKSSDPEWYTLIPELTGEAKIAGSIIPFEDRIRTATYFSAYIYVHSLTLLPDSLEVPGYFAVCGGGWKNPVALKAFEGILNGDTSCPILSQHKAAVKSLRTSMRTRAVVKPSEAFGFNGTAMEARIFADAAVCRVIGKPFTTTETTGADANSVCGIIRFPGNDKNNASATLLEWLTDFNTLDATIDGSWVDPRWNRASAGWLSRLP